MSLTVEAITLQERIGAFLGWISIGCWIIVYSPQIWTTYRLKSGEGISLAFLLIWLAGDMSNFVGAKWQGLLSTMVYLGIWYTFCDFVLLGEIFYFSAMRRKYPGIYGSSKTVDSFSNDVDGMDENVGEDEPSADETSRLLGYPDEQSKNSTRSSINDVKRRFFSVCRNYGENIVFMLTAVFVLALGIGSWVSTGRSGTYTPPLERWDTNAQIVGWISAFLYLASRIPQIVKNTETKCEGLSMLFFAYALVGNLAYIGSIVVPSSKPEHIWLNLAWLVGSGGTVGLDFIVLAQFAYYYRDRKLRESLTSAGLV